MASRTRTAETTTTSRAGIPSCVKRAISGQLDSGAICCNAGSNTNVQTPRRPAKPSVMQFVPTSSFFPLTRDLALAGVGFAVGLLSEQAADFFELWPLQIVAVEPIKHQLDVHPGKRDGLRRHGFFLNLPRICGGRAFISLEQSFKECRNSWFVLKKRYHTLFFGLV